MRALIPVSFLTVIVVLIAYTLFDQDSVHSSSQSGPQSLTQMVSDPEFRLGRGPLSDAVRKVLGQDQLNYASDNSEPTKLRAGNNADLDPGAYEAALVEREIDRMQRTEDDREIERAFPSSVEGQTLRRYLLMKRYPDQIPGAARLEADYFNSMISEPSVAIQTIAQILEVLPKAKFRDEHVTLRELADRLPEGHEKLQALLPDPDFR